MAVITEDTHINYAHLSQLSYVDDDQKHVDLFVGDDYVGEIKVWLDSEEDDREYICLNHEIIYLDTITKFGN